jgi:hypothetical protein
MRCKEEFNPVTGKSNGQREHYCAGLKTLEAELDNLVMPTL